MNEHYDVIACGTGFKECLLSGLLSVAGKKVLHVDRNEYYGADCASINITQFFQKFFQKEPPAELGHNRDWNIDLIPKFIMADGLLIKALIHTNVKESLSIQLVGGSYVFKGGKVDKVPSTATEALTSSLVGFMEKRRLRNFLEFVAARYENPSDPKFAKVDSQTAEQCMKDFGLDVQTMEFIGHAMALEPSDDYLKKPAKPFLSKLELYANSIGRYEGQNSPYLYPMYGLGDLPQAFARLCAIWGGVYMLNRPVDKILFDENGKAKGISSNGEEAYAPIIIGDPSYFAEMKDKVKVTGKTIRAICLVNHPIACLKDKTIDSANIIIPQGEVKRQHDIYICFTSYAKRVCPQNWYIALVSTIVETQNPEAEIKPALDLLGKIEHMGVSIQDIVEPIIPGSTDGCFCSYSYDPTTHFEGTIAEVLDLYQQIMGKPCDLDAPPPTPGQVQG